MKLIAIEASTETLSLAVQSAGETRECSMQGGANASVQLLTRLLELMAEMGITFSQLDAVVWGHGPGSFTGLRTACSVAQGIGFAHGLPLLGVDTLAACAQEASRTTSPVGKWVVALDARMNEVYLTRYTPNAWVNQSEEPGAYFELIRPQDVKLKEHETLVGNAVVSYPELASRTHKSVFALPTARAMLELAPELLKQRRAVAAENALPLYVRNKVALTTAEREQIKRNA
jgi:tRNA threonylcarbamoyladenosine biosynthesis protein TsaB